MKEFLKRRMVLIGTLLSLTVNIILLCVFRDRSDVTRESWFPALLMFIVILNGVLACCYKHKANYLLIGIGGTGSMDRYAILFEDKAYTFEEAYEIEFRWMLLVYCVAIPFYLPAIYLAKGGFCYIWGFVVLIVPQLVFWIYYLCGSIKDGKEAKQRRLQAQKELEEQKRREELGYWK